MNNRRLLERIRTKRQNVRFSDFVRLVVAMGFEYDRQVGSHRIFVAKPYQIKQFLEAIDDFGLNMENVI